MLLQLTDILRFMTIGCLGLMIVLFWQSNAIWRHKIPAMVFAFCVMGYLLVDWEPKAL